MPTFVTPEPIAVSVTVTSAEVRLVASERADTVVSVEPVDKASKSDVDTAERTKVEFATGQLTVTTPSPGMLRVSKRSSVRVTIELPADSTLLAKLMHARVRTEGRLGDCDVRLTSGQAQLDCVGALRASLMHDDIAVEHVTGSAEIDSLSGSARIGEVDGILRFKGTKGGIWIGDASDDLDIRSVNGDIEIDRADSNVTAVTVDGAVRVGRLTHGHADLMNSSANIEIGISNGTAAWVEADSKKGAVRNNLPVQQNPDEFDNTVKVRARTRSGDIIIRRAADESGSSAD
ncbi:DUF4097 family beta strand repeat-containing protein [Nocardia arthritidis]|uniref:DUF4097 family beta strand repeat protein n=1 Tax=Nocardia arthritidis TaxID=228602 RepID=A0A6G9Y9W7_9NOCA|nr:DUF4097 family beta strand repeat-containing protein [Nocardia arthritidis]QIS10019.1 DUF4097 family beta strand repeat protein [Nocardia arthritidis]